MARVWLVPAFTAGFAATVVGCSFLVNTDGLSDGPGLHGVSDGAPPSDSAVIEAAADSSAPCDPGDAAADPNALGDVVALAAGKDFTCALRTNGSVLCWGNNDGAQLGSARANSSKPVVVDGVSNVKQIAAGARFACALDGAGHVWCWGANEVGQLGRGPGTTDGYPPGLVQGFNGGSLDGVTAIAAGDKHACAVIAKRVYCWGANDVKQLGRIGPPGYVGGLDGVTEISAGENTTCAVASGPDGAGVWCWGANDYDQLANTGPSTYVPQKIPVTLGAPSAIPLLTVGRGQICARDEKGGLSCWGEDDFGQLGAAVLPGANYPQPQRVSDLGPVKIGASGDDFVCAIAADDTVRCLGVNDYGELGNGSFDTYPDGGSPPPHSTPSSVSGGAKVDRVYAGAAHSCAILQRKCPASTGGGVICWGDNRDGELGGGDSDVHLVPVVVRAPCVTASSSTRRSPSCARPSVACRTSDSRHPSLRASTAARRRHEVVAIFRCRRRRRGRDGRGLGATARASGERDEREEDGASQLSSP